nr:signal peptidase I [Bacillota bacterium]
MSICLQQSYRDVIAKHTLPAPGRFVFVFPDGGVRRLQPAPQQQPAKSVLREYLETLVGAVILAFLFMTFIARTFTVEGPSMRPTLEDGQRLLVDRLTYRFREPQRGEIIVFRYPADPSQIFIKRIIGVPGDEIYIARGTVYVNGVPLEEPYINGRMITLRTFGPIVVEPDTYFVLGDNRNNSEDSRDPRVGLVPRKNIIGRAVWRYWPVSAMAVFTVPESLRAVPAAASP